MGDPLVKTGLPLSLELGPGILDGIYVSWASHCCHYELRKPGDFSEHVRRYSHWLIAHFALKEKNMNNKDDIHFTLLSLLGQWVCPKTLQVAKLPEDGIQRPLERIQQLAQSVFVPRGVDVPNLDRDKLLGLQAV